MVEKELAKGININFFKWRSTGVLFLGVLLMIASMHYEVKGSVFSTKTYYVSLGIILISMIFVSIKWVIHIIDEVINKVTNRD